jgi:hypothetical protein
MFLLRMPLYEGYVGRQTDETSPFKRPWRRSLSSKLSFELTAFALFGLDREPIPNGPCYTFRDPIEVRLATYENQRPEVNREFAGRIDTNN